ncbi:MAG: hypothetical protein ATN35_05940 [Epulopiscium sp. Nele67-Bin004]|nr:MAG: hypothetical protein ATN35_05940 [Epulopiscium sp. Nele67-Bin004]
MRKQFSTALALSVMMVATPVHASSQMALQAEYTNSGINLSINNFNDTQSVQVSLELSETEDFAFDKDSFTFDEDSFPDNTILKAIWLDNLHLEIFMDNSSKSLSDNDILNIGSLDGGKVKSATIKTVDSTYMTETSTEFVETQAPDTSEPETGEPPTTSPPTPPVVQPHPDDPNVPTPPVIPDVVPDPDEPEPEGPQGPIIPVPPEDPENPDVVPPVVPPVNPEDPDVVPPVVPPVNPEDPDVVPPVVPPVNPEDPDMEVPPPVWDPENPEVEVPPPVWDPENPEVEVPPPLGDPEDPEVEVPPVSPPLTDPDRPDPPPPKPSEDDEDDYVPPTYPSYSGSTSSGNSSASGGVVATPGGTSSNTDSSDTTTDDTTTDDTSTDSTTENTTTDSTTSGGTTSGGTSSGTAGSTWENPFTDVQPTDWYYDVIRQANALNLFGGVSDTEFAPQDQMTRAMLISVIHRLDGSPAVGGAAIEFDDVLSDAWYTTPITWAVQNNIVSGYDATTFGTSDSVTREQMVSILWRYADRPYTGDVASLNEFSDAGEISSYAEDAMAWAYQNGIIGGKGDGILDPKGEATRAEVAAIVLRYVDKFQ